MKRPLALYGVPVQEGAGRRGCDMGPSAYRAAGIGEALASLGHRVADMGNLVPEAHRPLTCDNPAVKHLGAIAAWTKKLSDTAFAASEKGLPIFLGGDHSLAAGTLAGMSRRAAAEGRELFVLWCDAHPDFHTLETTQSGNLHGVPLAYATGQKGFARVMPALPHPVKAENVCLMGLRSVDPAEKKAVLKAGARAHDMRDLDENGIGPLLRPFLEKVAAANGLLHVSLDVDFLDPAIAPGVGTTVPGGATFREAHLVMEMVHDSGLCRALDLVELNPFLDERGKTALLMVELAASLMGKSVFDRPTRSG